MKTVHLKIQGMDCANCALTIERSVAQLPGIERVQVNFTTAVLEAVGAADEQLVIQRVRDLGYQVAQSDRDDAGLMVRSRRVEPAVALARCGAALFGLSLILTVLPSVPFWAVPGAQIGAMILAGYPVAWRGARSLIKGRQVTIELLMTLAALGAVWIGEAGEAASSMLLFAVAQAIERYTGERARDSLRSLLSWRPNRATVLRPCMDCAGHLGRDGYTGGPCPFCPPHEQVVDVEQVQVGETVLVRPGENIPVDGRIVAGVSLINQAPVTGESMPVSRTVGDEVFGGTINGQAAIQVQATRPAGDSIIGRIVRLVEQAQAQRAPVERFIDRFARWYTPAAVLTAILVACLPPLLWGAPWFDVGGERGWIYRALSLLLISCPCALVISTPVTMVSAMTALARRGVLIKGGAFLDTLARIKTFALDKTGTLTRGRPTVQITRSLECPALHQPDIPMDCASCDEMLALAAAVERRSEHPLAQAILAQATHRNVLHRYPAAVDVQALAGQGVEGVLGDHTITVGSHALFHQRQAECAVFHQQAWAAQDDGYTVIMVGKDNHLVGFVGLADAPRSSSAAALRHLKQAVPGAHVVMLTGDHAAAAQRVADQIGAIDEVRAGLLPGDKLSAVQALQRERGEVAMIGDGVNDAPALAAAQVGIAMGGAGTAQAMETADVVLMQDDLNHLADAVRTSRRARQVIQQNIAFSLAVKAVFVLLALGGWATLWMAVLADTGASVLVTLNGMRLLSSSPDQAGF